MSWLGGSFRDPVLWPRVGIWLLVASLITTNVVLLKRVRRAPRLADRLLLISLPMLAGLLVLLINTKRYPYACNQALGETWFPNVKGHP